jgi:biotin carboxyl carrier protein
MRRVVSNSLALLLLVPYLSHAQAEEALPSVKYWSRSLHPGEVVKFTLESSARLEGLQVTAFGKVFPFLPSLSENWTALIGIDLATKPGSYEVVFEGTGPHGAPIEIPMVRLEVHAKEFPTRNLTVDPKFVSPPEEELERIRGESRKVSGILAGIAPEKLWERPFKSPVPGASTSGFGRRSVFNGKPRSPHTGADFRAPSGTPVQAPSSGKVVLTDNLYYAGNAVILDHGLGLFSYFAHLSEIQVEEGDLVRQGQVVGLVGATGRVTGPHLHWAVRLVGTRVDPLSLIAAFNAETEN